MRTNPYPSDLTDAQWDLLKPLLPPASNLGRPRKTELRDVLDAIFYRNRNGCTWRALSRTRRSTTDSQSGSAVPARKYGRSRKRTPCAK